MMFPLDTFITECPGERIWTYSSVDSSQTCFQKCLAAQRRLQGWLRKVDSDHQNVFNVARSTDTVIVSNDGMTRAETKLYGT